MAIKLDVDDPFAGGGQKLDVEDPFKAPSLTRPAPAGHAPKLERTWGEALEDTGRGVMSGLAGLGKGAGDLYGLATGDMDNGLSRAGARAQEYWREGESAALKQRRELRSEAINQADGVLGKAGTAIAETVTDIPLLFDTIAENATTMLPGLGVGGKVAQASRAANVARGVDVALAAEKAGALGTKAAIGTGAIQQATDVASGAYQDAMSQTDEQWAANPDFQKLVADGADPAEAKHQLALGSARLAFPGAASVSLASQFVPGGKKIEEAVTGVASKAGPNLGRLVNAGKGVLGEGAQETIEEGGGQFVANMAQRYGGANPNRDLGDGVGEAAGLGFVGGAALGGGAGLLQRPAPPEARNDKPNPDAKAGDIDRNEHDLFRNTQPLDPESSGSAPGGGVPPGTSPIDAQRWKGDPDPNAPSIEEIRNKPERIVEDGVEKEYDPFDDAYYPVGQPAPKTAKVYPDAKPGSLSDAVNAVSEQAAPQAPAAPAAGSLTDAVAATAPILTRPVAEPIDQLPTKVRDERGNDIEVDPATGEVLSVTPRTDDQIKQAIRTQFDAGNAPPAGQVAKALGIDEDRAAALRKQVATERRREAAAAKAPQDDAEATTKAEEIQPISKAIERGIPYQMRKRAEREALENKLDSLGFQRQEAEDGSVAYSRAGMTVNLGAKSGNTYRQVSVSRQPEAATQTAESLALPAPKGQETAPELQSTPPAQTEASAPTADVRKTPVESQGQVQSESVAAVESSSPANNTTVDQSPDVLPDDITAPSGPWTIREAAENAAKRAGEGAQVVPVDGGFVVRKPAASAVSSAAAEAATSPTNDLTEPTDAQKEAGNFKVGRMKIAGMDVSIEHPAGVKRKADHSQNLTRAYGYIRRTEGADGEKVDVFLGENAADESLPVFVIDQNKQDGTFDEHKIVLGEPNEKAAREAYLGNYPKDWNGLGAIRQMTMSEFKDWVRDGDATKKPAATQPGTNEASGSNAPDFRGGEIIRLTDAVGRGGKLYQLSRDGKLFAMRAENGTAKAKRYSQDDLAKLFDDGKLVLEGSPTKQTAAESAPAESSIQNAESATSRPSADPFAANTLFTSDKVAAAKERMRKKLGTLNSGIDPELLVDGMTIAGAYIESGVRRFSDYAKAMVADFGESVRPYLLSFYEAARNYPGLDTSGMSSVDDARQDHANALTKDAPASPAIGKTANAPAKRAPKKGTKGPQRTLRQDWGVSHIDGWTELPGGKNQGGDYGLKGGLKDAFLADARAYLKEVSAILQRAGFEPHQKKANGVSVNKAGPAVSGEVSLTMTGSGGRGVYVQIGAGSLRGMVPSNDAGVSVMFRVPDLSNIYGSGQNQWAPLDLTAGEFAETLLDEHKKYARKPQPEEAEPADATMAAEPSAETPQSAESATPKPGEAMPTATATTTDQESGVDYAREEEQLQSRLVQWFGSLRIGGSRPRTVESRPETVGQVARNESGAAEQGGASAEEIRGQSQRLIDRAKAEGFYWDADSPILPELDKAFTLGGAEHRAFIVGEGENRIVIRATDNGFFGNMSDISPAQYLARLEDYNRTFPALQTRVIGVSESAEIEGNAVIWTVQPFVRGKKFRDQRAVQEMMAANGWEVDGEDLTPRYRNTETGVVIDDAHEDNVFYDDAGNVWPFDVRVEALPGEAKAAAGSIDTKETKAQNEAAATTEDNGDAVPSVDAAGAGTLEGAPSDNVPQPAEQQPTEEGAGNGGAVDGKRNGTTRRRGVRPQSGVGNGAGEVPVPAKRGKRKQGESRQSGLFADAGASTDARDAGQPGLETPTPPQVTAAEDFTITDDVGLGEGGQKTKYQRNVAAIRLLNEIQEQGRNATPEEQRTLALYVGWGGLAQAFDESNDKWSKEHAELKALLTPEEYEAARQSTQYAHYTSREIIGGIYDGLRRMGFTGGRVLEAGGGVGNFIGLMPSDMRTSGRFTLVERERIAAGIAKLLYPKQNVQMADFREFGRGEDGVYDAVIGNPPFGRVNLTDLSGRKHLSGLRLHNYFIAKSIDMLREGGILVNVVSNGFMDAADTKAREYIASRAKLIGAIRLPNDAFKGNAHTEVTTDIVIFQKLPESEWGGKEANKAAREWLSTGTVPDPNGGENIPINRYFVTNPTMMLGEYGRFGSMYGPDQPALRARPGQDTSTLIREAVANLPEAVYESSTVQRTTNMVDAQAQKMADMGVSEGGHFVRDGKLMQRLPDRSGEQFARELTPETRWTAKTALGKNGFERLQALTEMRGTLRALLAAELRDDPKMEALREKLNKQYDAFAKGGLINDAATSRVFADDPDYPLLASLELDYVRGMGSAAAKSAGTKPFKSKAKKAAIFTRRVIPVRTEVTKADSPQDALNISLAERGRIDAGYIGKLLGRDPESVLVELASGESPLLFKDPERDEYVLRDAYLSGNVRLKLNQARAAGMIRNAQALEKVIPEDVGAADIAVRPGSPWVPPVVYEDFAKAILGEGTSASLQYVALDSSFTGHVTAGSSIADTNTYGTRDYPASKLLMAMLNNREIKVWGTDSDGKRFVMQEATEAARDKAKEIRDKFADWVFADADRSELLVRSYNDANNNYVTRVYDGSWLKLPGKVPDEIIRMRRHQNNFIARVIQDRTALADHVVGAGKTFSAIAAAMELKRTGLANKPMIVVPNHLVKQWASDFYRLYPGANILTATKKDFQKGNRRRFLAKIAQNDWDTVIIAHSSYGFIKPAPEFEQSFIESEMADITSAIMELKMADGQEDKRKVKQLEAQKERLENRLKSLRDKPMDDLLDFEQLGVDQLFIDEAHLFKNLMFTTKMQNVRGLGDSKGSQRAYDMLIKTRQVFEQNGRGQGVVFLTGTPVSNSLAEMFHMMRYLMPDQMDAAGFRSFDAWANTFAEIEETLKPTTAGGYKTVTAFERFFNTFELLQMFDQVSDTVTLDDIKAAFSEENNGREFPIPKVKTGRRQPVAMEMSQSQTDYMEQIGERAQRLEQRKGPPKKGEDNHLTLMSDARKAAMDIRLVNPDIVEREKGARIDRSADEIVARYKQWAKHKGTQLVFSDLGTPIKTVKRELKEYQDLVAAAAPLEDPDVISRAALGDEAAIEALEDAQAAQEKLDNAGDDWVTAMKAAERGFSIYDDLKAALIERGIPENEIAFIHDYNTDDQKSVLFRKVNDGTIRVVMGSTPKMGAGTNVQKRLVALHHLDIPWKPSDVEQREGRIIRQGNELYDTVDGFEVEILAYVTKDTLDKNMWDIQERKIKGINQLRSRQISREIENSFDEMEMSATEMQAAATGNVDLLKEIQLRNDISKLERKGRAYAARQNDAAQARRRSESDLRTLPARLEIAKAWDDQTAKYEKQLAADGKSFSIEIGGKTIKDRHRAKEVARDLYDEKVTVDGKEKPKPLDATVDGEKFTNRTAFADAVADAVGDAEPVLWEIGGQNYRRRTAIARALAQPVADAIAEQTEQAAGTIGPFRVVIDGSSVGRGELSYSVIAPNGDERSNTIMVDPKKADDPKMLAGSLAQTIAKAVPNVLGYSEATDIKGKLKRAERTIADLDALGQQGPWPDAQKLEDLRAEHKGVIERIRQADKERREKNAQEKPDDSEESDNKFSLPPDGKPPKRGVDHRRFQGIVNGITAGWGTNAPTVRVVESADFLPESVRKDPRHKVAEGYYDEKTGTVYLVSANLGSVNRGLRVLAHEAIGHFGVEAIVGPDQWSAIEKAIGNMEKSGKYSDLFADLHRRYRGANQGIFTREAIAVMAEKGFRNTVIDRVMAAVRRFLRTLGFNVKWNDQDIRALIAQSARYIRGGRRPQQSPQTAAEGLRYSAPAATFYSAMAEAVMAGRGAPKRGTAEQWRGWMDGAVRRGEFKQSERDWLAVDDWLSNQDGPVTREQLAEFVRANEVQVQDVVLGGAPKISNELNIWVGNEWDDFALETRVDWMRLADALQEEADIAKKDGDTEDSDRYQRMANEAFEVAENVHMGTSAGNGGAKFGQYQLPGGENYRELLLTLPQTLTLPDGFEARKMDNGRWGVFGPGPLAENRYGAGDTRDAAIRSFADHGHTGDYKSSHFDQPNILAHVRFNERTDADGNRVLFLEEIQSDFGQDMRKSKLEIVRQVKSDFDGIVNRMKAAGVLRVECD